MKTTTQHTEKRITTIVLIAFTLIVSILVTATACTENQKQSYSINK